jgi:hypothetical protein
MHQYEIEAAIKNAVNNFVIQMGWINEAPRIQQISPDRDSGLFDDETVVKRVSVSVGQWSFDFLAILLGSMSCVLYMDSRTANLVMNFKVQELKSEILRMFNEHLQAFPHNMGM